jgi:hypothetical protein
MRGKYIMLENIINTIKDFSREDLKTILSILALVARIIFKVVCFYQAKQYHGKRVSKKQTKIDYKLIFDLIDLITRLVIRWLC